MENIDIVFIYERVARELDVACAIKYLLKERYGLRLEILQRPHGYRPYIDRYSPKVVCLPFCYGHSLKHHPFLYDWFGAICVNLTWEELLYDGNRQAKLPHDEFDTRHVYHHIWGDFFAETLETQGVPPELIFRNGNPTYALYDPPYRNYFASRLELARKYNLDPAKRWVFFPENYNWAFYTEMELKDFVALGGLDRAKVNEMAVFCRQSLDAVLAWCGAAANQENIELILRPRPTTPLKRFYEAATRILPSMPARLHITKDESIREWILASDIVISSYSTSLIEAAVADKQTYIVEPLPLLPELRSEWHDHATHLHTQSEFERVVLGDVPSTANPLGVWARRSMLANGDPILNLTQFLAGLCSGALPPPPPPSHANMLNSSQPPLFAWLAFEYQRLQGHKQRREIMKWHDSYYENEVASPDEIQQRVARWASILASP